MKPNELMIGDWVTFCGQPHKVISIDIEFGCNITDNDNLIKPEEISPIPLTEEILKANGFEKYGDYGSYILNLQEERKRIMANGAFIEIYSTSSHERMLRLHSIKFYVHNLQHALRLCGLQNIADNFKV